MDTPILLEKGLNLTDFHQKQWARQRLQQLIKMTTVLLISLLGSLFFYQQYQLALSEYQQRHIQLNEQKQQLAKVNQLIENLKNQTEMITTPLSQQYIEHALSLIWQIPSQNGGLENVQIYIEEGEKMKLIGKYQSQAELNTLQDYLHAKGKQFTLDYLHANESNVEFSLTVSEDIKEEE